MRTGYIHSSASLTERNGAGQSLRLVTWLGTGREVVALARLPIRLVLSVNPGRRPFVRRLIRDPRFAAVEFISMARFSAVGCEPDFAAAGKHNFLENFDRMKAA
jgi:hypothetical protein